MTDGELTLGHYPIGRGRIKKVVGNTTYLNCGCIITVAQKEDLKNHTWSMTLDYSNCHDHHHDEYCRP